MKYISNYGEVTIGPQFEKAMQELSHDMGANKRTKKYQRAKTQWARYESAIDVLAEIQWRNGRYNIKTP